MDKQITNLYFSWLDYSLFSAILLISALIGVYFGFFGKKQDNREEYIHGGRSMKVLPIAASLIATDISGITLLAVPADIYMNGSSFWLCVISGVFTNIMIAYVYLPVFYKLKLNSSFEYLKLRFDNRVRIAAASVFAVTVIFFMPIIIYVPALAFSQVSGVNLNIVIPIVCLICIFYTTLGGIKAVVWTDTVQILIMLGSLVAVMSLGIYVEGGFKNIWEINSKGGRIDFNLNPDPTNRTSSFAVVIGLAATYCGYGNNPVYIQRFLAVPSYAHAKRTVIIYCLGSIIFKSFGVFIGLIMYARYATCDPVTAGMVQKPDQLLPYYVMDVATAIPGLPGLFVAGIFCAALSTMSSGLNTMSGTVYEDFLSSRMPANISEKRVNTIMKLTSVALGLISMGFVFSVQYLGAIFTLTLKISNIAAGPILAMFTLGMLAPSINTKGILWGVLGGIAVVSWILLGSLYYELIGRIIPDYLPLSIAGCENFVNTTIVIPSMDILGDEDLPAYPYRITFYYYSLIGALVTTLIAIPVSWKTGGSEQMVDKDLLSPVIYPFLSKKYTKKNIVLDTELQTLNKIEREEITNGIC